MEGWSLTKYRTNLALLVRLIKKYKIPIETTKISELETSIQNKIILGTDFQIEVGEIVTTLDHKISGTTPETVSQFNIFFHHTFSIDNTPDPLYDDQISKYSFDLEILGYDDNMEEFRYAWHLDKNEASDEPKYVHPYYHFQGGGQKVEGMHSGKVLLVDFPRIPHPPMDFFLGIHFIIHNFVSSKNYPGKLDLLKDDSYKGIIIDSQKLLWDVYFKSFSEECVHNNFNFLNVFPLYIQA